MALRTMFPRSEPYGMFDALDAQTTSILGGEVVGFTYVSILPAVDVGAEDVYDGYVPTTNMRPVLTNTLVSGMRPLFLADEGTDHYGTIFGTVVGATCGRWSTGGANLGPHTATGSGKWTAWDGPGFYAVTLDAVDTTINSGLVPTNPALTGNDPLYATTAGTPNIAVAFEAIVVGRFIEFSTDGSLVRTPEWMCSALNSPSGNPAAPRDFTQVVFNFRVE